MKFISWNVNGIRACVTKGFLDFFHEVDADFFCIQESKCQAGQIDLPLEGYYQYWNYAEKKGYSGTAIFTKHEPLSVHYGVGEEMSQSEGRIITLEYENFYVVNVYTPNAQRDLARLAFRLEWEEKLALYLKELDAKKLVIYCGDLKEAQPSYKSKPIIICGDLNVAAMPIDLKNPGSNRNNAGFTDAERAKFQTLLDSGFTDSFRFLHPDEIKYSWWSYMFNARAKNAGWRIDYFLTSQDIQNRITAADIRTDVLGSDHAPILLEVNI